MAYITFEGIDGSGKSTQFKKQIERLRLEHEVGEYQYSSKNNLYGRLIKEIYSQEGTSPLSFLARFRCLQELLYGLSARQNIQEIDASQPGLVLSDRSIITAYVSHLNILPQWYISMVEPNLVPDLAVFIDVPPEICYERISSRNGLFLEETVEDMKLFRDNYHTFFNHIPSRFRKTAVEYVDGNRAVEEVYDDISLIVDKCINKRC